MSDLTAPVRDYLDRIVPVTRRAEAELLIELFSRVTGATPELHYGSTIGFGHYHYRYRSGREGYAPAAGFAPRRAATTVYLTDGIGRHEKQLARLGPHRVGVGCVYVRDLDEIDLGVLEEIVAESFTTLTRETYTLRAREGSAPDGES